MPYTKNELITALTEIQNEITQVSAAMPYEAFLQDYPDRWSAAEYLQHLILSVKPLAKALAMPPAQLGQLFGAADHPSRSFEELVADYEAALIPFTQSLTGVTPVGYRMPEEVTHIKHYLIETWQDANQRLFTALAGWSEDALDQYHLQHPLLGMLTVREMLFFTLHHNRSHCEDIRNTPQPQ